MRFIRWLCAILGFWLFLLTALRMAQPPQPTGVYRVVYGDKFANICCASYMINEDKRQADRVRVGLVQQTDIFTNLSPSGQWKFANVLLSIGSDYRMYFIPINGGDPLALPSPAEQGWYAHWGTQTDTLYWFARESTSYLAALYRATPEELTPERISDFKFGGIRTVQEQPLPFTPSFEPWMLWILSVNLLVIAGCLKYIQPR